MHNHNPRAGAAPDVLPVWSWGLPLASALVIGVLAAVLPSGDTYERVLRSEYGVIEIATLAACLVGFVLSLKLAWRGPDLPYRKSFRLYMLLFDAVAFDGRPAPELLDDLLQRAAKPEWEG